MTEGRIWASGLLALLLLSLLCCWSHYTPAPSATASTAQATTPAASAPAATTAPAPTPVPAQPPVASTSVPAQPSFAQPASAPIAAPATAMAAPALVEPSLSLEVNPKGLVILRGVVSSAAVKASILARTARIYGATQYIEGIQLAQTRTHEWFNALAAQFPPDLRQVSQAQASSQNGGIVLSGEVAQADEKTRILATAVSQFGSTVSVTDRLNVRPAPVAAAATAPQSTTMPPAGAAPAAASPASPAPAVPAPAMPAPAASAAAPKPTTQSAAATGAVLEKIFFVTSSAQLTPKARAALRKLAATIKQGDAQSKFSLVGFADSRGPAEFNQRLSERRAKAVSGYLARLGVSSERLSVDAKGATDPAADNDTVEGRRQNRRVEVRLQ